MTTHAASPASTEIKEGAESRGRRARATRSRRIGRLCFATISLWLQKAKRAEDRQRQAERQRWVEGLPRCGEEGTHL